MPTYDLAEWKHAPVTAIWDGKGRYGIRFETADGIWVTQFFNAPDDLAAMLNSRYKD
jgi:hypothetical protein